MLPAAYVAACPNGHGTWKGFDCTPPEQRLPDRCPECGADCVPVRRHLDGATCTAVASESYCLQEHARGAR